MAFSAVVKGVAAAAVLGVGGFFAADAVAPPALFPPPVLSASTVTVNAVPNRVAFLVRWVRRCAGTTCPTEYGVTAVRRSPYGYNTEHEHVTTAVRDTVVIERGICADPPAAALPDTVSLQVVAHGRGTVEQSNAAVTKFAVRCRPLTAAERAEDRAVLDTFPAAGHKIQLGDWSYKIPAAELARIRITQLRQAKTAADSATISREFVAIAAANDSLRTGVSATGDSATIQVGMKVALCLIAKNRYTGQFEVLSGDVIACEGPRARLQSRRDG